MDMSGGGDLAWTQRNKTEMSIPLGTFPEGLRVLVVDDEPLCLMILDRMLRQCKYNVTTCNLATEALSLLRENRNYFDLVISDVYMPDMDGFKLLEAIGLELDLPVIMMSAVGETDLVMKGITHGACDYLLKPVRLEELRNIWQHVIRRRVPVKDLHREEGSGEWDDSAYPHDSTADTDHSFRKRKERVDDEIQRAEDLNNLKKARVVWSPELHKQFVQAVNQLGIEKAVPKRILDVMSVQGLTRENVASHLQKYRLYLKRLSGVNPQPYPVASFQAAKNGSSGGVMQIQPGGRAAASSSSGSKGWILGGVGLGRNVVQKDTVDRGSLQAQLQQKHQQQQLARTFEGLNQPTRDVAFTDLQRMGSNDLDLLMKTEYDASGQPLDIANDQLPVLGNLNVLEQFDLSGLIDLREGENPVTMSNLGTMSTHNNLNAITMENLRRAEDMGSLTSLKPGNGLAGGLGFGRPRGGDDWAPLEGTGLAEHLALKKFGGEFTSASCFSSVDTSSHEGISETSFKDYNDFGGPSDLLTPPHDLPLS
ncbi:unnamed protein product [Sphagnum troendelagicum]|uniref:Two-component response regulator n=1 Tax=Sphagnum troendelagicum TaxID=128251 RepID=A0ABP0U3Y9_9BRYO